MAASYVQMTDLTIAVGQTLSNIINSPFQTDDAEAVLITAPTALDAGTYSFLVNANPKAIASDSGWTTLQIGDPAADAVPPAAGKARVYYELADVGAFRIQGPAAVGIDRVFKAGKSIYL